LQLMMWLSCVAFADPGLLSERFRPKGKDSDPITRPLLTVLFVIHQSLAALDVGRLHISDRVPLILQTMALLPIALGWIGIVWSMKVNRFFSSAVRLQPDRGQIVINAGPYAWVRHPGYVFASLGLLFQGIAFGSWLSVVPVVLIVLDLLRRTVKEESLLIEGLPGYKEYTEKVRFRWLPGVW